MPVRRSSSKAGIRYCHHYRESFIRR